MRAHPVGRLEIFSGIGDQRTVARMIDGLHRRNDVHQFRLMAVNVLHELGLCIGRAGDEDGAGAGDRIGDRLQESLILRGMSAPDRVGFVMDVSRRMIRMQNESFDVRWAELENTGFVVIDPNDGMVVMTVHD